MILMLLRCLGLCVGLSIFPFVHAAEYSVSMSGVSYKTDYFETFKAQRSLLYSVGFPDVDKSISQYLDSSNDGFQITGGYHFNEYFALKASYLGKSDYSLRSNFSYAIQNNNGELIREIIGQDVIKSKVIGSSVGIYSELPIRRNISVGSSVGAIATRNTTSYQMSGELSNIDVDGTSETASINAEKTSRSYDLNHFFGLYIAVKTTQKWRILMQWQRYFNIGEKENYPVIVDLSGSPIEIEIDNKASIDAYLLGLERRF